MNRILYISNKDLTNIVITAFLIISMALMINGSSYSVSALEDNDIIANELLDDQKDNVIIDEAGLITALSNPEINTIVLGSDIQLTTALKVDRNIDFVSNSEITRKLHSVTNSNLAVGEQNRRHILVYGEDITLSFENIELIGQGNYANIYEGITQDKVLRSGGIQSFAVKLTVENAIIKNCFAWNGGGIGASGEVIIKGNGTLIAGNAVPHWGGGVYAENNVTVLSGTICDNRAITYDARGGGVYTDSGDIYIYDGTISGNISNVRYNIAGGGIYAFGRNHGGNVYIRGGTISGNKAIGTTVGATPGNSGGGGIAATNTAYVDGGEIAYNTASGEGYGGYGGGIYADKVEIINGIISNNKALKGTAEQDSSNGSGGGISCNNIVMHGGIIYNNEADSYGGGIFCSGTFIYNGSTFSSGYAEIISGEIINNKAAFGGGIYANYYNYKPEYDAIQFCDFTMSSGVISDNIATENGGGIWTGDNSAAINGGTIIRNHADNDGGGIWTNNYPELKINGAEFAGNTARIGYPWQLDDNGIDSKPVSDAAIHESNITNTVYSDDFTNAYNNYDINYEIYIVKFMDGGTLVETRNVYKNSLAGKTDDLSKTGSVFDGWYEGDIEWDFENNLVEKNITLYAKWSPAPPATQPSIEYTPPANQIIHDNTFILSPTENETGLSETETLPSVTNTDNQQEYEEHQKIISLESEESSLDIGITETNDVYTESDEKDMAINEEQEEIILFESKELPLTGIEAYDVYEQLNGGDIPNIPLDNIITENEADVIEINEHNDTPLGTNYSLPSAGDENTTSSTTDVYSPKTADNIATAILIWVSIAICGILFGVKLLRFDKRKSTDA